MISLKKILCPIDHSDCSKEALRYAVSFARKDEAKLILLHVIDIRTFNEGVDSMYGLLDAMPTQIPNEETLEQLRVKLLDCIPDEIR